MRKKKHINHKKTYVIAKHHAWAGSVLLAVLLALRVFIEISDQTINNMIFLILGSILVIYILIALGVTYKHRLGLIQQDKVMNTTRYAASRLEEKRSKDQLKIEKKKAKNEAKKIKKQKAKKNT